MTKPEPVVCWRATTAALPGGPSCGPKLLTMICTTLGHTFLVSASSDSFSRARGSAAAGACRATGCAKAPAAMTSEIDSAPTARLNPGNGRDTGMEALHQSPCRCVVEL